MAFCTSCGKEIDSRSAFCTYCGARVEERVTADIAEDAYERNTDEVGGNAGVVISQEPPVLQRFPMKDGNDSSAGCQGVSGDVMNGGSFSSGIGGGSAPFHQEVRPPAVNDLLENWKYDPFLVAVGFIPIVLFTIASWFYNFIDSYNVLMIACVIGSIILVSHLIFSLVYVFVIHKSLFTEKPMIKSAKLVCFLNAFAGSAAGYFGLIGYIGAAVIYERLNAELKNRKRGYAWVIMLVFCILTLVSAWIEA